MIKNVELLLIDDDSTTLFIHEKILSKCTINFPHKSFNNAMDCLYYMEGKNTPEQRFILFLDINMPQVNGWKMLELIKEKNFKCQSLAIMATSSIDYEDKSKAKNYESVIHFFEKPLTLEACEKLASLPEISALS